MGVEDKDTRHDGLERHGAYTVGSFVERIVIPLIGIAATIIAGIIAAHH